MRKIVKGRSEIRMWKARRKGREENRKTSDFHDLVWARIVRN